jgi:tRNA(Leu) C34 or U34 (ribose-2'-O)-methylase TrmL
LGERVLSWCRDVVYIPTNGCLNLAACVNVVLYDRQSKSNIAVSGGGGGADVH